MNAKIGVPARRKRLQNLAIGNTTHPGLALQRYLAGHKPKERDNQQSMPEDILLDAVSGLGASEVYEAAFHRWRRFATAQPSERARVHFTLTAASPIAIGLGNASPLEVGMTLHHTYGMPIIPGSALKGLCRRGALQLVNEGKLEQKNFEHLFGAGGDKNAAAGAVVFYDALYVPDSVGGKPFHRDVITVHHPEYYGSRGAKPPTDFDDPNPVPFLVVKPGAQFLFVLDAITLEWAQFTEKLLRWCLANLGVGAKTNAGYGYFALDTQHATQSFQHDAFQAHDEVWENALVKWIPGQSTLRATNPQNVQQTATIGGDAAKQIYESFPDTVQELLKTKGIKARVEMKRLGRQLHILRIIPVD